MGKRELITKMAGMYGEGAIWLSSTANVAEAGATPFEQPIVALTEFC